MLSVSLPIKVYNKNMPAYCPCVTGESGLVSILKCKGMEAALCKPNVVALVNVQRRSPVIISSYK